MLPETEFAHGFSTSLYARRGEGDQKGIIIGGKGDDETDWTYTLTTRAAQSLWYDLTRLLYPERSGEVIANVSTMRSMPKLTQEAASETTHTFVRPIDAGGVLIEGIQGNFAWTVQVSAVEIYRFWAEMDKALHPTGW
jgi:hypothetical protein